MTRPSAALAVVTALAAALCAGASCAHSSRGSMEPTAATPSALALVRSSAVGGTRLAVSADGHRVIVGTAEDVAVLSDLVLARRVSAPGAIDRLRLSSDGRTLLAAPEHVDLAVDGDFAPADASSLDAALRSGAPEGAGEPRIRAADFAPEGKELVAAVDYVPSRRGSAGSGPSTSRLLWLSEQRGLLDELWAGGRFAISAVLAGNRFVVAAIDARILVWDRPTRRKLAEVTPHTLVARDLALSPDESLLASGGNDGRIVLTRTGSWQQLAAWDGKQGEVTALAFQPGGRYLASTGQDGSVRVWSLAGEELAKAELGAPGTAVAFSGDGTKVFGLTDGRVVEMSVR